TILLFFLIIFSMKRIEFDTLVKYDLYLKIILTLMVVAFYYLGLTDEFTAYRDGVARISFGFGHPNTFGFIIAMIAFEFIYINRENIRIIYILPIIVLMCIVYKYSDSRASCVLLVLLSIVYLFQQVHFINILYKPIIKFMISNSFIIFTIISLVMTYLFSIDNSYGIFLNDLFNTRLYHILRFLNNYNINLFGNNLILISTEEAKVLGVEPWILDNSFLHIILRYGLIIYGVFAIYIKRMFEIAYSKKI
ncbi:MAG: hypothetical protein LUG21_06365, partial [Clostridiales bacterium]|nr:hypothetical protein [Clostridiales bacterium]